MTIEAKPEFGEFLVEVGGKVEITRDIQATDGRSIEFIWKRGKIIHFILLTDSKEKGGVVIIRSQTIDGVSQETIELNPNESRHWHENDLLLTHRCI